MVLTPWRGSEGRQKEGQKPVRPGTFSDKPEATYSELLGSHPREPPGLPSDFHICA